MVSLLTLELAHGYLKASGREKKLRALLDEFYSKVPETWTWREVRKVRREIVREIRKSRKEAEKKYKMYNLSLKQTNRGQHVLNTNKEKI